MRLLVVDDEEQVRLILRRQLERLGYQVTLAADGPTALNELAAKSDQYAAVLVDMTLPEMDGVTLTHVIAERHQHVRLLLMSGFHATELRSQIAELPIAGFCKTIYAGRSAQHPGSGAGRGK
ncbi:MAG: response regulator [Oscillochloris sp.]|nr:response regulator [Oscillochloris sp.]